MTPTTDPLSVLKLFRIFCGSTAPPRPPFSGVSNWERWIREVSGHGLLPQLAELLAREDVRAWAETLPEELKELVRARQRRIAIDHLAGLATVADARRVLGTAEIPFVVLKGPALALQLYGRAPGRAYVDVDLWVRPADREAALDALAGASYRPAGGPLVQWLVRRGHFHLVLLPAGGKRLKIELHWSLVDRANLYRLDEEEIFARRRCVASADVPVLAIDDELIYLAVHLAKHGILNGRGLRQGRPPEWFCDPATGNRLGWFLDIHSYLCRYGDSLDWAAVRRRATRWNVATEVGETLAILELLARDEVSRRAREVFAAKAADAESGAARPAGPRSAGRLWRRALTMQPDIAVRPVRLLVFWRTLFPPPADLRAYYVGARWRSLPWLYLRHPVHMVLKVLGLSKP